MTTRPGSPEASTRRGDETPARRWVGVLAIAAAAIPIGAALWADDAKFYAPRWLVAMVGGMFAVAGVLIIRAAAAPGWRPESDMIGSVLGGLMATGFTVLSGWALFFSGGPSAWGMSGSLPLWLLPPWASTGVFYLLLGVSALLCVVVTVYAWRQAYRALVAARSGAPGSSGLE
jgi:hypothetical protein